MFFFYFSLIIDEGHLLSGSSKDFFSSKFGIALSTAPFNGTTMVRTIDTQDMFKGKCAHKHPVTCFTTCTHGIHACTHTKMRYVYILYVILFIGIYRSNIHWYIRHWNVLLHFYDRTSYRSYWYCKFIIWNPLFTTCTCIIRMCSRHTVHVLAACTCSAAWHYYTDSISKWCFEW